MGHKIRRARVRMALTLEELAHKAKISKAYLGDANRYMEIFNANQGTLTNPDQIKVGQQLLIPQR